MAVQLKVWCITSKPQKFTFHFKTKTHLSPNRYLQKHTSFVTTFSIGSFRTTKHYVQVTQHKNTISRDFHCWIKPIPVGASVVLLSVRHEMNWQSWKMWQFLQPQILKSPDSNGKFPIFKNLLSKKKSLINNKSVIYKSGLCSRKCRFLHRKSVWFVGLSEHCTGDHGCISRWPPELAPHSHGSSSCVSLCPAEHSQKPRAPTTRVTTQRGNKGFKALVPWCFFLNISGLIQQFNTTLTTHVPRMKNLFRWQSSKICIGQSHWLCQEP